MPDPAPKPDAIDQANDVFWNPSTLEELVPIWSRFGLTRASIFPT